MNNYEPLYQTLQKKNMSLRTLSTAIGFSPASLGSSISRKENLTSNTIDKICGVLNCTPSDILEIVPEGTVIEHKRTCCLAKRKVEGIITVNWEKLEALITESGYSNKTLSEALGKNWNYITRKKQNKHNSIEFLKTVTDFLKADSKDYIL